MVVLTESMHDIHIGVIYITAHIVQSLKPTCAICGDTITQKDGAAINVTVAAGNTSDWYHDTNNCFQRYMFALAHYFNNKHGIDTEGSIVQ